jgi:hypothetical protein
MSTDTHTIAPVFGISIGNGGWLLMRPDGGDEFYVRVADHEGRLEPVELYFAKKRIDPRSLRELPIRDLEATANDPSISERIRSRLGIAGPLPGVALSYLGTSWGTQWTKDGEQELARPHWVADMWWSQIAGSGVPPAPPARTARRRASGEIPSPKLTHPITGSRAQPYGESFYREVAEVYAALAGRVRDPAQRMADANGVMVTTVNRWTRIARERGFLPPARQGRAG